MSILVSGSSGFLAEALIPRLKGELKLLARNEGQQKKLQNKYPESEIIYGDIADSYIVAKAMTGVDQIYHLAAFKHVRDAEDQAYECTKTNIIGTKNLIEESIIKKPTLFVFISTDKAAQIAGVYGSTKYIGEKLIQEASKINPDTHYVVVRYGNILYSTGSVMCLWKEKMQKGEPIKITNPDMTRFYWTREEAVNLIFEAIEKTRNGEPHIPEMKAMRIGDILEAMMQKYGRVKVEQIGSQAGENIHETMDGKTFSNQVERYTIKEIIQRI